MGHGTRTGSTMTLAEFQQYVETAVAMVERSTAGARHRASVLDARATILRAIEWIDAQQSEPHRREGDLDEDDVADLAVERGEYELRLAQLDAELHRELNAGEVPELPLRSIPMDMIAESVARRLLKVPAEFPILSIKALPKSEDIDEAVLALAQKWRTANGPSTPDPIVHV